MGSNWNWGRIDQIVQAWQNPLAFSYRKDKDIVFNGRDILPEVNQAIAQWRAGSFYDFGIAIGQASAKILDGKRDIENGKGQGKPNTKPGGKGGDPKIKYA